MKMMEDRLKVQIIKDEEKSAGGIYRVDSNPITGTRHNYFKGIVMEAGKGRKDNKGNLMPMTVKVGDTIIYPTNHYTKYDTDDLQNKFHIIPETDVYAILTDEEQE